MALVTIEKERIVKEPHQVWQCDVCGTRAESQRDNSWLPPIGWIQLRRVEQEVHNGPSRPAGDLAFCSWSCTRTYVKVQVDQ